MLLVDELAHTNATGSRHTKRWQDIEELLAAGINVWTTLNVQHIESLNDVVGQITGITVRETVPDQIFDIADDLELVDVSPEELVSRLQAGKVYVPEQAQRAIRSFFQKSNLMALRELSLRRTAQRVHVDVESARRQQSATEPWATADRILVCVGPSPTTSRVIRTAKRMAVALNAPWVAVAAERTGTETNIRDKEQIAQHFRLAENLGAETATLSGDDIASTILDYARSRNITRICIGKTLMPRWKRLLFGTLVDEILERSGSIDVHVIHGQAESAPKPAIVELRDPWNWWPYVSTISVVVVSGLISQLFHSLGLAEANLVMVFLAGVAWAAFRYGHGPAIFASLASVLVFDFFFVPPYLNFAIADTQYLLTFGVMLSIGLAISTLTAALKRQVANSRLRELRITAMYQLGKQLTSSSGEIFLLSAAGKQIAEMLRGEVVFYRTVKDQLPRLAFGEDTTIAKQAVSLPAAIWTIAHNQLAGAGTDTLPNASALFLPLSASQATVGAMGVRAAQMERLRQPDLRRLLESFASQLALALERDEMAIDAAESRIQAEAEQVRSSLLSSVSHDLKTPLATIAGASSSLLQSTCTDDETRRELLESIYAEATRLNHLLENILQMSRLDADQSKLHPQWHVLEEIVGSAIQRTQKELAKHPVTVKLPVQLPLVSVDGLLLEQLFVNLLENAARYTPPTTPITITGNQDGMWLIIVIADAGPGLISGTEERIFERFYRASPTADAGRGSGLGLAICRAIAQRHGGTLTASNRSIGGAEFVLRLPLRDDPPSVEVE